MTSVNIDNRIIKFLEWHVRGFVVIMIVIGFMVTCVSLAQAQAEKLMTVTVDAAGVVSYSIPLSPTLAIVDPSEGLNIRKGPNAHDYVTRGGLLKDDKVIIRGTNSSKCLWVYITETSKDFYGWVYSGYLRNLQGNLIYEECPPTRGPKITPEVPATYVTDQHERSNRRDETLLERYNMLVMGIIALILTTFIYWIAYTKGLFSRLRQTESSAGIFANSTIPKAGMPYLEAMQTSDQPIYCSLNRKAISIGRDKENMLMIDSRFAQWDTVSSHHARIEHDGDSFIITDLDSKNGVFVDGRRTQENILYDGMQVSLGKVAFVFRVNEK